MCHICTRFELDRSAWVSRMPIEYFDEHILGEAIGTVVVLTIKFVLIVPNWGKYDLLLFIVAFFILMAIAITTIFKILSEPRISQLIFITVSLLFLFCV